MITDSAPNSPRTVRVRRRAWAFESRPEFPVRRRLQREQLPNIRGLSEAAESVERLDCLAGPRPPGATCTVPATQILGAKTTTEFGVRVTTAARTTGALRRGDLERLLWLSAFALMAWVVLPVGGSAKRCFADSCRGSHRRFSCSSALVAEAKAIPVAPRRGTYTLTVTATAGTTSQPTALTLTVQ